MFSKSLAKRYAAIIWSSYECRVVVCENMSKKKQEFNKKRKKKLEMRYEREQRLGATHAHTLPPRS